MGKKEKTFQAEISKSFNLLWEDCFYLKIPDAPYSPNIIQRPIEKPCDVLVYRDGVFIALELKMVTATSMSLSNIREHQIKALDLIHKNGGFCAFVFNVSLLFTKKQQQTFDMDKKRVNFVYVFPITEFMDYVDNLDRKSIPLQFFLDEYKQGNNIVERKKFAKSNYGWEIDTIWNMIS